MTARKLHISPQLALPQDTVTSTMIVYGGKGMGKTNFGSVLAEECAASGLRFAIIDPMGVWWGLRHSADGKGPGIEVLILGGIHGDIPIEPTGGAVVADLVVDEDANVIIDISRRPDGTMWSIADRVRFVRDYCKRLYQRQGEKRRPLLQGLDEAARFIPQIIRKDDSDVAACMGAIAVLVEEGRNVGIGVCLITQRSARLNKDVAELADCMVAFRTVGPNSRRAVLDWLGEHVDKTRIKEFDEQLRALPRGSALVVSPGWLEFEGIVPMRMRQTFDSSATPKVGQTVRASGPGAKPDLAKYQARMAATIEKAKAEDPKLLQQRVKQLEKELASKKAPAVRIEPKAETTVERVAVPMLTEGHLGDLKAASTRLQATFADARGLVERIDEARSSLVTALHRIDVAIAQATKPVQTAAKPAAPRGRVALINVRVPVRPQPATDGSFAPTSSQQRILNALRWLEGIGIVPADRGQLALMADQPVTSGGYKNNLGALRSAGLVEYQMPSTVALTDAGRARADASGVPTSAEELHQQLFARLPVSQARIVEVLIAEYPKPISREELAERVAQPVTSGGFKNNLGALRTLGVLDYPTPGQVVARPVLFLEGAA